MITHRVIMRQPSEQIVSVDIEFMVREGSKKLGELHVSKESIEWLSSNGRYKRQMSQSKFVKMMQEEKKIRKAEKTQLLNAKDIGE